MKNALSIVFIFFFLNASAGELKTIYGKLVSVTGDLIQNALISTNNSSLSTPVNKDGSFEFSARVGDTLFIHSGSFYPKSWCVPSSDTDVLFPEITLVPKERIWKKEAAEPADEFGQILPILVMGSILDDALTPLPGASIKIANTFTGVASNKYGSFKIEVMTGDTLEIRSVGYKTRLFTIETGAEAVYREVILEADTTLLNEVKVMPWLTKENMSYEEVPLDASEINRMYLREKALYTDKTRFRTVSFNFAPLLTRWLGKGVNLIKISKKKKKQNRIDIMRQNVLEQQAKRDSLRK